ncbi:hypothetical protein [Nocardia cyriacigeorgica]|uniref:hypothetical protein n=1 Tax=Nocardia cyriacigeorgica TaxID=135487 RepID=UPI0024575325|nr:hypothetical protein [Nocardia cyriacigeorgica]
MTVEEADRVIGLLEEADDLIIGYLGPARLDPVPEAVRRVAARLVARVLEAPRGDSGVESAQMTAGPFQWSNRYSSDSRSGGPWLTRADRIKLRPYKMGAFSVRTW